MENIGLLTFGQPQDTSKERRMMRTEAQRDHVNTSLCRFTRSVRQQLVAPLHADKGPLSALDWYNLACSEAGPNAEELEVLGALDGLVQDFNKGEFAEFRIMRVLEELRQEGLIDDFVTDYHLPRVKTTRSHIPPDRYAHIELATGTNMNLDPFKIDALASKVQPNGDHLYIPLQIKFKCRNSNGRSGSIYLTQKDAAEVRREFSGLKHCFNNLQKPGQVLHLRHLYYITYLAKKDVSSDSQNVFLRGKTKTELKDEIAYIMTDPQKTFSLTKPIEHFWGLPLLKKLLETGLLEGIPQEV